jgi:DNA recombination protein RmuC
MDGIPLSTTAIAVALVIFLVGAVAAWLWTRATGRELSSRIRELEAEGSGRQSVEAEVRRVSLELRAERDVLREKLEMEQQRRIAAETTAMKARENLEEQKKLLDEARAKFSDAFQGLASDALGNSMHQFLELANAKFESLRGEAEGDLEQRRVAIEGLVRPLGETLGQLNDRLSQVESSRQEAYGELKSQVQMLAQSSKELRDETGTLSNALKQPQVKGRWGELTLRRVVELAGMSAHCDFDEQASVDTESGRLRPDMTVHLPGGGNIVVDAKVPLSGFLTATTASNDDERAAAMEEHTRLVRSHVQALSAREYWKQFEPTPEFVVLFVPGESFFSAALDCAPTLIEEAIDKRVVLASPTTLIALMRAIAYGWRQEMLAENAERISELGKDLYERLTIFAEHLSDVRKGLERANDSYTKAVRSFNTRLLPGANKFTELGVASTREIEALEPVESLPEPLSAPVVQSGTESEAASAENGLRRRKGASASAS